MSAGEELDEENYPWALALRMKTIELEFPGLNPDSVTYY